MTGDSSSPPSATSINTSSLQLDISSIGLNNHVWIPPDPDPDYMPFSQPSTPDSPDDEEDTPTQWEVPFLEEMDPAPDYSTHYDDYNPAHIEYLRQADNLDPTLHTTASSQLSPTDSNILTAQSNPEETDHSHRNPLPQAITAGSIESVQALVHLCVEYNEGPSIREFCETQVFPLPITGQSNLVTLHAPFQALDSDENPFLATSHRPVPFSNPTIAESCFKQYGRLQQVYIPSSDIAQDRARPISHYNEHTIWLCTQNHHGQDWETHPIYAMYIYPDDHQSILIPSTSGQLPTGMIIALLSVTTPPLPLSSQHSMPLGHSDLEAAPQNHPVNTAVASNAPTALSSMSHLPLPASSQPNINQTPQRQYIETQDNCRLVLQQLMRWFRE
uniref:Uncharacterized protein n=1 Tax=Moniliophthora roreri TaxID=221103 RepID=A0A0W0EZN0_MONRR